MKNSSPKNRLLSLVGNRGPDAQTNKAQPLSKNLSELARSHDQDACNPLLQAYSKVIVRNPETKPLVSKAAAFVCYLQLFEHLHTEYKSLFNKPRRGCDRDSLGYAKRALDRGSYLILKAISSFEYACNNDEPEAWSELRTVLAKVASTFSTAAQELNINYRFADHSLLDRGLLIAKSIRGNNNLGSRDEIVQLQDYVKRLFPLMGTYAQAYNGVGHHIVGKLSSKEGNNRVTVRLHLSQQSKRLKRSSNDLKSEVVELALLKPC